MRLAIVAFSAGVLICQWQVLLLAWPVLALIGVLALAAAAVAPRVRGAALRRASWIAAGTLAGFAWASGVAQLRLADALDPALEGRDIRLVGTVIGLPETLDRGQRFEFELDANSPPGVPRRLLLGWYRARKGAADEAADDVEATQVHAGERWQLTLRLKRPHGNINPHGFDYEALLFERGLRATGYVRKAQTNARLDDFVPRLDTLVARTRERVRERIQRALPDRELAGVLVALVIGDQNAIDADLWTVFNRTGVTHLMAISGLHITMIAGLFAWLVSAAWRRVPWLALRLPAQKAAVVAGWTAALLYCLLAGFGVPAQRTLIMISVVALALWRGRVMSSSRVLMLALLLVSLRDPMAVLSAGFWLSFGAVAALMFAGSGRVLARPRGWRALAADALREQGAVTLALTPALLALFQQLSLVSPLANAIAIPLVSFVITPLAMLGSVLPTDLPLQVALAVMNGLMQALDWLAAQSWAVWQQAAPPWWATMFGLAGCAVLLLPRGMPARLLGLPLLLPMVLIAPARPPSGDAWITVLDVGQGLSVHVQTASHDLIYDTGPQFSADANSGNRIIVPYLRAAGVQRLDRLIVTHQDIDHSGGAESLYASVPIDLVLSSLAADTPFHLAVPTQQPCMAGQNWEWDGVRFEMLHPRPEAYALPVRKTNDMSCVLRVTAHDRRMLLTGDIEAVSEADLLARDADSLRADVLLVPHHGSRTSSTAAFIGAVGAQQAVFPVGYRNRFHHPNPEVLSRYELRNTTVHRTDRDGAVQVRLDSEIAVGHARDAQARYWNTR